MEFKNNCLQKLKKKKRRIRKAEQIVKYRFFKNSPRKSHFLQSLRGKKLAILLIQKL